MTEDTTRSTLHIWLAIMVGCILFSSAAMLYTPGATGMITGYSTETPEFNPSFISEEDAYSQATTSVLVLLGIVAIQGLMYVGVTRHYG